MRHLDPVAPGVGAGTAMKAIAPLNKGYRRLIPSMTALVEFEAVARLGSFTLAARELGVTQAAVSRQIRMLEDTLGAQLFERLHRAIRLTADGELLQAGVSESMQKIASVFDRIAHGGAQREVVITATSAFSHFCLIPRIAGLAKLRPDLQVRVVTQMFTADLRSPDADIGIRFGDGVWPDCRSQLLFTEQVFPVCSPAWLSAHAMPGSLADLVHAPLIESDSTSEGWIGWDAWLRGVGARPPKLGFALRTSLYTDAIAAARYGQGIALGWGRLVGAALAAGDLVRLPIATLDVSDAYYVVIPNSRHVPLSLDEVVAWLQADAA